MLKRWPNYKTVAHEVYRRTGACSYKTGRVISRQYTDGQQAAKGCVYLPIDSDAMQRCLVHWSKAVFPAILSGKALNDMVKLRIIIAKDGSVRETHAISSPQQVVAPCEDAVKTWRYKPVKVKNQ